MTPAALATVLFSHSPAPQTAPRTNVPPVQFAGTEQPTATNGLGVDEP